MNQRGHNKKKKLIEPQGQRKLIIRSSPINLIEPQGATITLPENPICVRNQLFFGEWKIKRLSKDVQQHVENINNDKVMILWC